MDAENRQHTYTEVAKTIRPVDCGPIHTTIVEKRFSAIKQQKYQYYDGTSGVMGSPFMPNGTRNQNFTSPSFLSNSVFYNRNSNFGASKNDMYKTTANLFHCNSFDKLKVAKDQGESGIVVRK